MKLTFVGLFTLMLSIVVTPVRSETVTLNPATATPSSNANLSPFHLVFLAYQGHFRGQGIPSYDALTKAHKWGKLQPRDLVQVAVQANRLPAETLNDKGYLRTVEANLRALDSTP
jgi:hypothetical protein